MSRLVTFFDCFIFIRIKIQFKKQLTIKKIQNLHNINNKRNYFKFKIILVTKKINYQLGVKQK